MTDTNPCRVPVAAPAYASPRRWNADLVAKVRERPACAAFVEQIEQAQAEASEAKKAHECEVFLR